MYSLCHIKCSFGVTILLFSVHYPSINEYRFGRPATDENHLCETRVMSSKYLKLYHWIFFKYFVAI